ncbi:RING-H2 finger protein [Salix suchowensis]|nr:RING-H2 finger protein [Salix suchowensis]
MNGGRPEDSSAKDFGGFALIFGVSIGVLSAIAMVIFVYYFFITRKAIPAARFHGDGSSSDDDSVTIGIGLDEATLDTYPKLRYSEAKKKLENGGDSAAASTSCSICLADYADSDLLRLLPDCDHLFHSQCIDPWFKLHTSCPICRNSPSRPPQREFHGPWYLQFAH